MTSTNRSVAAAALAAVVSAAALAGSLAQARDLPAIAHLPLSLARQVANAALDACSEQGERVSVAIVDRSGNTQVLLKGDGTGPHTVSSSVGKAFTAASMGRDTRGLADFLAGHRELDGLRDMDSRLLILAGGLPIVVDEQLVGGIGVGGAPSGIIDETCAQAGIDTLEAP